MSISDITLHAVSLKRTTANVQNSTLTVHGDQGMQRMGVWWTKDNDSMIFPTRDAMLRMPKFGKSNALE